MFTKKEKTTTLHEDEPQPKRQPKVQEQQEDSMNHSTAVQDQCHQLSEISKFPEIIQSISVLFLPSQENKLE